jgi:hypothetical protein
VVAYGNPPTYILLLMLSPFENRYGLFPENLITAGMEKRDTLWPDSPRGNESQGKTP